MSQTPRVPRFYVNTIEYLKAVGLVNTTDTIFNLNPTKKHDEGSYSVEIPQNIFNDKSFAAFLAHEGGDFVISGGTFNNTVQVNAINVDSSSSEATFQAENKGFSILSFEGVNQNNLYAVSGSDVGSIVLGTYWEAPHAVDLNVSLGYDVDGVKQVQTKGGSTLSNATHIGVADWWNGGAWQVDNKPNMRTSRRTWAMSFSYFSEDNVFPKVAASTNLQDSTYEDVSNETENTLYDSTDFFTQVWNRTLGSHLEFILQPDKNDFTNFSICRFDQNSLKVTQTAPFIYQISLKIREVY